MNPSDPQLSSSANTPVEPVLRRKARPTWLIVLVTVLALTGIGVASMAYWYERNLNASDFVPVKLNAKEEVVLQEKVSTVSGAQEVDEPSKTIVFNEREVNAYLAQQGWGEKLKVAIGKDQVSFDFLVPVHDDVMLVGGRTVRLKFVFNAIQSVSKKISFTLADVRMGGISLPNAWLGNVKGVDLLDQIEGENSPLASAIAAGIRDLQLQPGELKIHLNE